MQHDFQMVETDSNQTISFRKVRYDQDVKLIHKWMMEEHVIPYWNLNIPYPSFQEHLKVAIDDKHQDLYIGCLGSTPMSYWETYWVKGDVVESTYPATPYDQGVHLLIGEKEFLGKGLALSLLRAMVRFQFQVPETKKVIAEPDIRNEKMIHVFEKCGFKAIKPITLPDKIGLLMFCERQEFEKRWSHEKYCGKVSRHI